MEQTISKAKSVGKFVDTEHVQRVRANYKAERWIQNSRRLGKEDSLSVWYSADELEGFLAKIKEEGGDGVRMYFGAYGLHDAPNPLYAGRQTIVMVATKQKEADGVVADKDLFIHTEDGANLLAYNAGRPCPPFCIQTGGGFEEMDIRITDLANQTI